ncbi:hypothetical protein [Paludibacterium paludis]|uniref:Uncharacterized protein n=1 Tax=Paludibacterium paludis TaxID=1225769 RepID=A0A918P7M4_9NEIS|nr:hypothetical protein [Paludibacterium paludis]GGY28843.1 hypothetical protein GCM10011289_35020 [Paludibacterium paludis]
MTTPTNHLRAALAVCALSPEDRQTLVALLDDTHRAKLARALDELSDGEPLPDAGGSFFRAPAERDMSPGEAAPMGRVILAQPRSLWPVLGAALGEPGRRQVLASLRGSADAARLAAVWMGNGDAPGDELKTVLLELLREEVAMLPPSPSGELDARAKAGHGTRRLFGWMRP